MDVRALIETGNFQGQELISTQLAPAAVGFLAPWTSASRLFSDRSFVLNLFGSVSDPQVRVVADETIQVNVRRRLIQNGIGLLIGDAIFVGE